MKVKAGILVFLILFSTVLPIQAATDEGYGEDETSLGQFVDSFEDLDNVSVAVDVIRNSTFNAMELNSSGNGYKDFTNFIEFDIDYNRIGSNLSSFPVLLNISDGSGINDGDISSVFDAIGESYLKIAITNSSMLDEYFIEVESWDGVGELAYLWFSPDVSSLENSTFRLHYGSSAANNTLRVGLTGSAIASNVWDGDFVLVHHLNGDNQTDTLDSTSNNMDATGSFGDPTYQVPGQIDGSVDFDGNDDISIADNVILEPSQLTLEVWIKTTANLQFQGFIDRRTGNTEGYSIFYPDVDGKPLILIEFGGGLNQEIKSSVAINNGAYHYVAGKYDEVNLKIYVDGVETGTIAENDNIVYGNHAFFMPGDQVSTHRGVSELDEVRLSKTPRSADWINGTYFSGIDNLIYWGIEESTSGFSAFGYFTTVDYLSDPLANGSALTALFNTSIPANTQILVEFSEDNSTWVFNDWAPLFGGFEAVDLRDLNYSTGFYSRFNLSTTDPAITPRVHQNRLITTIGEVGAGIPGQNVTGEWIEYRATAINASVGIVDEGDLNSTFEIDDDTFNVSEVVGAPGMLISVNFSGIDPDVECVWITIWYLYDGNLNHVFEIEMWNFTSSSWVTDGLLVDTAVFVWANSTIYAMRIPNEFLSGGEVRVQLNHETPGNINHDLFIDYIRLIAKVPSDVVAAEELFQFFWIVLAIALTMIILIIAKMWFEEGDP